MERATFAGLHVDHELGGDGELVVLVHHGAGRDWFAPFQQPLLASGFRVLRYHRPGYGGSSPLTAPLTFTFEVATFRGLMRSLGIERAHVIGHSASGCIALQLAIDAPDIVHSLVLLEPALMAVPSPPGVPQALEHYRAGRTAEAIDVFLGATCGPQARATLAEKVPGAMELALQDADTFFGHELPALRQWHFGADEAKHVEQPVLAVVGERSDVRFHQRQQLLLEWLPDVEPFLLTRAGHLLHLDNPGDLARGIVDFLHRHPVQGGVRR
jgi:pimeloyl-ACP methyl ester carboxylesterase